MPIENNVFADVCTGWKLMKLSLVDLVQVIYTKHCFQTDTSRNETALLTLYVEPSVVKALQVM